MDALKSNLSFSSYIKVTIDVKPMRLRSRSEIYSSSSSRCAYILNQIAVFSHEHYCSLLCGRRPKGGSKRHYKVPTFNQMGMRVVRITFFTCLHPNVTFPSSAAQTLASVHSWTTIFIFSTYTCYLLVTTSISHTIADTDKNS